MVRDKFIQIENKKLKRSRWFPVIMVKPPLDEVRVLLCTRIPPLIVLDAFRIVDFYSSPSAVRNMTNPFWTLHDCWLFIWRLNLCNVLYCWVCVYPFPWIRRELLTRSQLFSICAYMPYGNARGGCWWSCYPLCWCVRSFVFPPVDHVIWQSGTQAAYTCATYFAGRFMHSAGGESLYMTLLRKITDVILIMTCGTTDIQLSQSKYSRTDVLCTTPIKSTGRRSSYWYALKPVSHPFLITSVVTSRWYIYVFWTNSCSRLATSTSE